MLVHMMASHPAFLSLRCTWFVLEDGLADKPDW